MKNRMSRLVVAFVLLAVAVGLSSCATSEAAPLQTAGSLLVNLEAKTLPAGKIGAWPNSGTLGGTFKAKGTAPRVYLSRIATSKRGPGLPPVAIFSGDEALVSSFKSPKSITGDSDWSLELWAYKLEMTPGESTMVSWGPRSLKSGNTAQFCWGQSALATIHWGMDLRWKKTPPAGKWQYIAVTYGAGTETVYVNGQVDASVKHTLKIAASHPIVIGAATSRGAYLRYFQGAIGAVRIHDGALTAKQIAANFERDRDTYRQPLPAVLPSVKVTPAAGIRPASAYLSGHLNSTGGAATRSDLFWGEKDGGSDAKAWGHSKKLGQSKAGALTQKVTGLKPDTAYAYRFRSTNSAGVSWSETAGTFKTAPSIAAGDLADQPFRILVWPDSQNAVDQWPQLVKEMAKWVVENRDELNIQYVIHVGDMVQTPSSKREWKDFDAAFSLLDGKVPYILSVGNHDMARGRNTDNFNKHFPPSRFAKMKGYGLSFPKGTSNNSYHTFNAGGQDWLILSLMFNPNKAELAWANKVVASHPKHKVLVSTHSYLTHGGKDRSGKNIWETFAKKHPNILCVFCGHLSTVHFQSTGDKGNPVYEMLFDWQNSAKPDRNSYLALIEFNPKTRTISVETYSPVLDRFMTGPRETFRYKNVPIRAATKK